MPDPAPPSSLKLVSLRTRSAEGGATFDWHTHPFEEFTFVTDDSCLIGYPPGWRETEAQTLLHYRAGDRHGAFVSPRQRPRFWVVHFSVDPTEYAAFTHLNARNPAQRAWSLDADQSRTFQWMFLQLVNEHSGKRPFHETASSAWLQVMLIAIERWAGKANDAGASIPSDVSPEVLRLWHAVNESVSKPNDELADLYSAPNYDSVRHAFRKTFGCSPRAMLQRLRMEHAKNLLLESSLSIKEISARVGYLQQHDFCRMFRRYAGLPPSKWRTDPLTKPED